MSTFGTLFRVTTFGESHCFGVGAIVDGVPPQLELTEADIQPQLTRRRPGQSALSTPRNEADKVSILSGTERGRTLGTPIGLLVKNKDQRPGDYKEMSTVPRPSHADFTYQVTRQPQQNAQERKTSRREKKGGGSCRTCTRFGVLTSTSNTDEVWYSCCQWRWAVKRP
eukprot:m.39477 g.39477  ORF g.39477 m.39477 type:complete len:168 (-) comp11278_c0_seq1:1140-1643(-)